MARKKTLTGPGVAESTKVFTTALLIVELRHELYDSAVPVRKGVKVTLAAVCDHLLEVIGEQFSKLICLLYVVILLGNLSQADTGAHRLVGAVCFEDLPQSRELLFLAPAVKLYWLYCTFASRSVRFLNRYSSTS